MWPMVSTVRHRIHQWLLGISVDPTSAELCANASSELVENCIKYSRGESMAAVAIQVYESEITVETINSSSDVHTDAVRRSIEKVTAVDDLKQIFVEKLMNSETESSQLGLIKIAMETKGKLAIIPREKENLIHIVLRIPIDTYEQKRKRGTARFIQPTPLFSKLDESLIDEEYARLEG